jgi:hypothetical protein
MYNDLTVEITLLNVIFSTMERLNKIAISNGKHGGMYNHYERNSIHIALNFIPFYCFPFPPLPVAFLFIPAERCWHLYTLLCFPFPPLPPLPVAFLFVPAEPVPLPSPSAPPFSLLPPSLLPPSLLLNSSSPSLALPLISLAPQAPLALACWLPELCV